MATMMMMMMMMATISYCGGMTSSLQNLQQLRKTTRKGRSAHYLR
jgi:hypothetical protein